jgi:flagellar hook-associated protein 1 FlgK
MSGSFSGFNVAVTGLFSAQKNLNVVNHNVGNANTPGYSRQESVQQALRPMMVFDGSGMVGLGSSVLTVNRLRNEYMDSKYWGENKVVGEFDVKEKMLRDVESIFGEPSESGITTIMNEFYNSLHELQKDPGSPSARSSVSQNAVTLTRYFNNISGYMEKLQLGMNQNITSVIGEVNSIGEQIVKLNQQIFSFELTGNVANDLRDKRTLLIDKLSNLVDVRVEEVVNGKLPGGLDDKRLLIHVGGNVFINDSRVERMHLVPREEELNQEDIQGLFDVKWGNGKIIEVRGGALKGYLEVRDGNGVNNQGNNFKGVPFYVKMLNEFVGTFAKAFNEGTGDNPGHAEGFGISFDSQPVTGIRFFTKTDERGISLDTKSFLKDSNSQEEIDNLYKTLTAKNFSVSSDVLDGYFNISVSKDPNEKGNGDILENLIALRHDIGLFQEGAPEDFLRSVITTLAVDLQQSSRMSGNSKIIIKLTENRRLAEAGVSIDEELTNMLKHQQAYAASARLINTWSEIYEILLNNTGIR